MRFKSIHLSRNEWGPNKGQIDGYIEFDDETLDNTKIQVGVNPEQANKMLAIVADAMVSYTAAVSNSLKNNIQQHQRLLGDVFNNEERV